MKKQHAFFISLLFTLLILGNYLFFNANEIFPEREIVIVKRVIDGDTVELADGRTVRLLNVNTPERGRPFADESTAYLKQLENKTISLETEGTGAYDRTLGRLYDGTYINLELVRLGFAHAYLVDPAELKEFKQVEQESRANEQGIWKRSEQYGCVSARINPEEEFVLIEHQCERSFAGWMLKDESTKQYQFTNMKPNAFILYSGSGVNNETAEYWGRGSAWNDDHDSIFIRDEQGLLVYYDSYGY